MEHEFEEWQQAVLPKLSIKFYIEKNQICILYMYLQFVRYRMVWSIFS